MQFVFIIAIIFALVLGIISSTSRSKRLREAYSRVAEHYGGTLEPGGMFTRPKFHYKHEGASVTIDVYSTGGEHPKYYTQAHFRGTLPSTRCEVYPERMWQRLGKLIGMEDIQIGSAVFDDEYVIKGSDPAQIKELLNPAVQEQINRLRRFLGNDNIYVSFNSNKLLVKKLSYIRDYAMLMRFTQLASALYDLSVSLPEGALTILKQSEPSEEEALCQICGDSITQQRVLCRRCKTPHHLDCWEYYGGCSTYGCKETRYTRPKAQTMRSGRS